MVSVKERYQLTRQLSILLNSGLPLLRSLELLKGYQKSKAWQILLEMLIDQIKQGFSLSKALKKFPHYFSSYYCSLIECGESCGKLVSVLEQLAHYQWLKINFKKKCIKALLYPGCVLSFSFMMGFGMLTWVVPQFAELFAQSSQELPYLTRCMLSLVKALSSYGSLIMLFILVFIYALRLLYQYSFKFRWCLATWTLKLPIMSDLIQLLQLNHWLPLMSIQLKTGFHLFFSLKIAEVTLTHLYYQAVYAQLLQDLKAGSSLKYSFERAKIFPPTLISLIEMAEHSGSLESTFSELAADYEERLSHFLLNLTQLVEPLCLLLMASLSAMLIIALYLPIFRMGELF